MILGRDAILQEIHLGNITVSPFIEDNLGTNSLDIRLGNWFYEVVWKDGIPQFKGPEFLYEGARVEIPVGGTLLASTMERVGCYNHIVASMRAKSTIGRMGITVCRDAGMGDIGYDNLWTMEISASVYGSQPVLFVGEEVAQMVFHRVEGPPAIDYTSRGQYNDAFPECMIPKKWRGNG